MIHNAPEFNPHQNVLPNTDGGISGWFYGRTVGQSDMQRFWTIEDAVHNLAGRAVTVDHDEDLFALPYLPMPLLADGNIRGARTLSTEKLNRVLGDPARRVLAQALDKEVAVTISAVTYDRVGKKTYGRTNRMRTLAVAHIEHADTEQLLDEQIMLRAALGLPLAKRQQEYGPRARLTRFPILQLDGPIKRLTGSGDVAKLVKTRIAGLAGTACLFGAAKFHEF